MRDILAVVADFTTALALSAAQFVALWYIQAAFTADRFQMFYGSPLSLLLGPALFVLIRWNGKSKFRITADIIVAALLVVAFIIPFLTIGGGVPSLSEDLETLLFAAVVPATEAVALIAVEKALRRRFRRR